MERFNIDWKGILAACMALWFFIGLPFAGYLGYKILDLKSEIFRLEEKKIEDVIYEMQTDGKAQIWGNHAFGMLGSIRILEYFHDQFPQTTTLEVTEDQKVKFFQDPKMAVLTFDAMTSIKVAMDGFLPRKDIAVLEKAAETDEEKIFVEFLFIQFKKYCERMKIKNLPKALWEVEVQAQIPSFTRKNSRYQNSSDDERIAANKRLGRFVSQVFWEK